MTSATQSAPVFQPEVSTISDRWAFGLVHRVRWFIGAFLALAVLFASLTVYVNIKYEDVWLARAGQSVDITEPTEFWPLATLAMLAFSGFLFCFYSIGNLTNPPEDEKPSAPEPRSAARPDHLWDRELDG